ncbi:MAG TPA: APC family permease [Bacteroidales bacterium]|nr:APC family permease [Bacteroidales bacterium]
MGGEIKKPEKTIPAGVLISMIFVLVLYMSIQVIVQAVLGDTISLYKEAPLAQTAAIMFGNAGAAIVVFGAVFSMFGNISGMVLNMPRVLYAAARDRVIPSEKLARIHPVFRTPYIAIIVYSVVGFLFSSFGEFRQLAMLSSASYMIIYFGVAASVIKFRLTGQRSGNFFMGYVVPVISCLVIFWVLSKLPVNELTGMIIFLVLITIIYFPVRLIGKKQTAREPH